MRGAALWAALCCLSSPCLAWPHKDPLRERMDARDAAFPYGYTPTEQERKAVAPNEMASAFMGGRHTVDSNEPDVQHLAQWSMSHVDACVRAGFKDMKKVVLSRVVKAEKQLLTVLDCRYFLVIEAAVHRQPAEQSGGMVDDGATPQEQLALIALTLSRNLQFEPTMGTCKVMRHEELERRASAGRMTFQMLGPDADITFNG